MSRPVIIFGATDLARLAHHYLTCCMGRSVSAYAVDREWMPTGRPGPAPVMEFGVAVREHPPVSSDAFVAVGYRSMQARQRMHDRVAELGYSLCSVVAPSAHVSPSARVGANCFIHPGAVIEPFAQVGSNVVVWSNAVVCHDASVGDHSFVAAGAVVGGHASIGPRCFIGFGATILQSVSIGADVLVAASSMMRSDAQALGAYRGTPARRVAEVDAGIGVEVH